MISSRLPAGLLLPLAALVGSAALGPGCGSSAGEDLFGPVAFAGASGVGGQGGAPTGQGGSGPGDAGEPGSEGGEGPAGGSDAGSGDAPFGGGGDPQGGSGEGGA